MSVYTFMGGRAPEGKKFLARGVASDGGSPLRGVSFFT